ncbi:hypothetical protein [Priestia aryabhattai]|uniref:hypothetical protein n=1 Tax=Priestia aryabhattai TaxID=412384 RepID=UPI003D2BDA18
MNITSDEGYLYLHVSAKELEDQKLYFLFNTINNQGQSKIPQIPSLKTKGIDFVAELNGKEDSHLWIDSYYDTYYFSYAHQLQMIPSVKGTDTKDNGMFNPIRLALNKELAIGEGKNKRTIPFDAYETGKLQEGNSDPNSSSFDSLADFKVNESNGIAELRIPWALLNVKDPSQKEIMGDIWSKKGLESSEKMKGIQVGVVAVNKKSNDVEDTFPTQKKGELLLKDFYLYKWKNWEYPTFHERIKPSYFILQKTYGRLQAEE